MTDPLLAGPDRQRRRLGAVVLVLAFGVLAGGSTGLGYTTAVRVASTAASGRGVALGLA